jgi:HK97 family phage major capsid protein
MTRHSALAMSSSLAALAAMGVNDLQGPGAERRVKQAGDRSAEDQDPDAQKAMVKEIKQLATDLAARDKEMGETIAKAVAESASALGLSTETKAALEAQAKTSVEILSRLTELEQKATRGGGMGGGSAVKSLGQSFVDDEGIKKALAQGDKFKGRASFSVKAITSVTGDVAGAAGDLIQPTRVPGIVAPPDRELRVRSLLTPGRTSSNSIEYVQETGFTNAAAPVAETTQKPESTLKFDKKTAPVRTLAHWIPASKQILDDVPALVSYIDARLRYGLALVEDAQLLLGDGTGENILGIIPQATEFDDTRRKAGDTMIDTLRRSMTQARLAGYPVTFFVMHPTAWEEIELTKTDDGAYIFANPTSLAGNTLWGRQVVETDAMPEGDFLTGSRLGGQIFDREDANVEISTEDRDNFIKNMVTIRGEERLGLAVYRPDAFITGEFEPA